MVLDYTLSSQVALRLCVRRSRMRNILISPLCQGYHSAAIGKGRQLAKTELEKLKLSEISLREAVIEAARM